MARIECGSVIKRAGMFPISLLLSCLDLFVVLEGDGPTGYALA
jgi:hypothetical protein